MLITLLVTLLVTFYLWWRREFTVLLWTAFTAMVYLCGTALVVYELSFTSPDLTYGSDARYYWEAVGDVLEGKAHWMDFSAPLYVLWATVVVSLSPSASFIWLLLANIALLSATFALQGVAVRRLVMRNLKGVSASASNRAVAVLALMYLNGIVIWTVARGLKEVLIWFLVTLSAITTSNVLRGVLAWGLWYLRPMGAALVLVPVLNPFLSRALNRLPMGFLLAFLVGLPVIYELFGSIETLVIFRERFGMEEGLASVPAKDVFLLPFLGSYISVARFILGPGPIRSVEQLVYGNVFEVSTKIGDVLILFGSVHWWGLLIYTSYFVLVRKGRADFTRTIQSFGSWFWLGIAVALTYAFIYFGTGDTRHRATLYVVTFPFFAVFLTSVLAKRKAFIQASNHTRPTK